MRAYLLSLVAICIVLATGAFALILNQAQNAAQEQARAQARETAKVLSHGVDREVDRALGILSALSQSRAAKTQDWAALDRQARAILHRDSAWIVVQDRAGRQLVNTRLPYGAELPSGPVPRRMWAEIDSGEPRICNLSNGAVERHIVCVDAPVGGRNPAYAVSVVLKPQFFDSIVRREGVAEGSIATLADRDGKIIWRNLSPDKFVGQSASGAMLSALKSASRGGVLESTSLDGVRMLSAYQRSPLSGWSVIVGTPIEHVAAAPRGALVRGSLLALAILAVGCLLAFLIARRLARAVKVLGQALEPGAGAGAVQRTGIREIDDAAAAIERAFAARSESEQRFREVADAAPVLIWVADTHNKGIWYNKAWLDFTGRSLEQELGDGWLEAVHPDDLPRCSEICGGSFERREPFKLDFRLRRSDGEWRILEDNGVPRFADDGTFLGYIGTCVDVSETRAAEARIRASEARYRRIFEQTSDLIFTADLDQVITDSNPAAAEAVGLPLSDVRGRRISDFLSPEDFERTTAMLRRKMEGGGTTRYDVRVRNTNGEWLSWEINSGLTFDEAGRAVGLHVVGRDVTERKRSERQKEILIGELNHRVKNTLAVVQSIAQQTFQEGVPVADARRAFEGRLGALASAHNLLTEQRWEWASMQELVQRALAPFCSADRREVSGEDFRVSPQTAVSVTLAIHELATNAAKYGALSNASGRIHLGWTDDADGFRLEWREEGGPTVAPRTKKGFGTRLIERSLAAEFGGRVEIRFEPTGVVCTLHARAARPLTDEQVAAQ